MNIVTGYRGFIGSHICDRVNNIFAVEQDDCYNFLDNFTQWDRVQMVYHMGAISDTTCNDVAKLYHYNVNFTIRLLEKCIQHNVPVRYASSAAVYGNVIGCINPLNQYAMSKAVVDLWVQDNIDRFAHVQALRFFNVYGNGEEHKGSQASPVTQFRQQAANGVIRIFEGSEDYFRDFVCVEDVCEIAINNTLNSGVYDVGTGRPVSFAEVANLVQAKYGGEIVTVPFPRHLERKYQYHTCASTHFNYVFTPIADWLGA